MRHSFHSAAALMLAMTVGGTTANAGLLTAFYNYGHSNTLTNIVETDDLTQVVTQTLNTENVFGDDGFAFAGASVGGLRVAVDTYESIGAVAELEGMIQFESSDPGITHVPVLFAVDVNGLFNIQGSGASVRSTLRLSGLFNQREDQAYDSGGPVVRFSSYEHTLYNAAVPVGVPVNIAAEIRTGFLEFSRLRGISDFGNSLTFNANQFLQIDTPGVTVHSIDGDWLVDNRLAIAAVPEPSSLVLAGAGIASLLIYRRRRRTPALSE